MSKLTKEQFFKLKAIYEELKAIESSLPISTKERAIELTDEQIVTSYHNLVNNAGDIIGENLVDYRVSAFDFTHYQGRYIERYKTEPLRTAIKRIVAYLNTMYELERDQITEIGNIIQAVHDEELKSRCIDLLSAKENFDRVIREATTILENRIRTQADPNLKEIGVKLVDKTLNPKSGLLILEGEPNEQEGFYQLYRGVMLSFRDETHHKIVERFTREDALKTLAFIDILLETLDKSKRR